MFQRNDPPAEVAGRVAVRMDQARAGLSALQLAGHRKVRSEWQLVCAALNLKIIAVLTTA